MQLMKGFHVRPIPVESVGVAAKAVARRQAEQLTVVRRRAQPTAVYIARLTVTAVFAYLLALQLPGGSPRSVLAPLTALLVVQATLFNTIGSAIRRVAAVTVGVLAAVAVAACEPTEKISMALIGTSRISSRSRSTMPSASVAATSRPSTHQLNGT